MEHDTGVLRAAWRGRCDALRRIATPVYQQPDFGVFQERLWLVLRSSWTMDDMTYSFSVLRRPSSAHAILLSQPST